MPVPVQDMALVVSAAGRTPPADVTAPILILVGWVVWLAALAAVVRLMWIGAKFGMAKWSGEDFDHSVVEIALVVIGGIIASTAGGWVTVLQR
ncbi:hypothetical protein [Corynebacterium bovis]|uniref:hypothetical protein n=1 Tax=Corynebacterium bovis TaxID=36808 RepID=UPI000FB2514F|nr:hypothetical protein [Corynebacterium bovis]RRQ06215.1 hypothetical protein CXF43_09900 [Corynebacterium bovis]RRQ09168.1 hypothetical protein CXF44_08990 [Corynebacterium bovis]